MRKFEGSINGKIYTDENEFNDAIAQMDDTCDICVSYKFVSVPDTISDSLNDTNSYENMNGKECDEKYYVSENQYIKNITNKNEVELDSDLINKIKCASNKSDIERNVCKRIVDFDNMIGDNLLHINELKSEYKKLDEKIKLINNQIKTLDDANNNYYLNKEYYTNIKDLLDKPVDIPESKDECKCDDKCKCGEKTDVDEVLSLKDIYNMSAYELAKYINKRKIYTLADLVEYFLKH
jgi:hypothetical protein